MSAVTGFSPASAQVETTGVGEPESDYARSFRTHAAYLRAMRNLALGSSWRPLESSLEDLAARAVPQVASGTRGADIDLDAVLGCLNRAWGTELILATTSALASDSEVIRLANSWGSVQAYYALYGATQAVLVAEGRARPQNHETTRKAFVDLWVTRRIDLAPWTFALAEPGTRMADVDGFIGGPGRPLDTSLHAWSSWGDEQCWDIAAKALRGVRKHHVDEQYASARTRKRAQRRKEFAADQDERVAQGKRALVRPPWWDKTPNLTSAEKAAIEMKTRPTTIIDHLYRLRIRANYEDTRVFSDGPDNDEAAAQWSRNLVAVTSASLLVHELRLLHLLGKRVVVTAADQWLARNRTSVAGGLSQRRGMLG